MIMKLSTCSIHNPKRLVVPTNELGFTNFTVRVRHLRARRSRAPRSVFQTCHPRRLKSARALPSYPEKRAILLVSDDAGLGQNLERAATQASRTVVRVNGATDALRTMRIIRPAAVLLDLDLPAEAAWAAADLLLQEESCPPVILLTARGEQFEVRTAVRAGSLVDKSAGPVKFLEVVDHALAAPNSAQAERNAIQLVAIRWLRPCGWSVRFTPAHRFWGIHE
jgi:CheY-like chemotaxis protein